MNDIFESKQKNDYPNMGSVYEDLKERVSNPFLSSYIISFLVLNWQVWIGLFFLNQKEINDRNFSDTLDYIFGVTTWKTLFLWPSISALVYSFAFPWFKNCVKWVQAKSITANNNALNKVAKNHVIPVDQYLELEEKLEVQKDQYGKAITLRSHLESEISRKNQKITELNNQITLTNDQVIDLNNRVAKLATINEEFFSKNQEMNAKLKTFEFIADELLTWKRLNNISFLQGEWIVGSKKSEKSIVKIEESYGYLMTIGELDTQKIKLFEIKRFAVNAEVKVMIWLCTLSENGRDFFKLDAEGFYCYEVDHVSFKMSRGELEKFVWEKQPKYITAP